jgi:hypothetical protein
MINAIALTVSNDQCEVSIKLEQVKREDASRKIPGFISIPRTHPLYEMLYGPAEALRADQEPGLSIVIDEVATLEVLGTLLRVKNDRVSVICQKINIQMNAK